MFLRAVGYAARPAMRRGRTHAARPDSRGATGKGDQPVQQARIRADRDRAAKPPPLRISGVMFACAICRTYPATSSDTLTCWPVARAKSHACTRNSIDKIPRAAAAGSSPGRP